MHKKLLYEMRDVKHNKTQYKAFLEDKRFGGIDAEFKFGAWKLVRNSNGMFDGSLYLPLIDHTEVVTNCLPWTAAAVAHQWWYASTSMRDPDGKLTVKRFLRPNVRLP